VKKIQVLGPGCPNCERLYEQTRQAARVLGLECEIEKVSDMRVIAGFGVLSTPALVVDGQVRVTGRVPPPEELRKLLT
jgi:small redox-active disulfide protein 2